MKNYTVTFTERDVKALMVFLARAPLKGEEVSAFISLRNAVNAAKPTEEPKTQPAEKV
jgi:hypothetical protein